MLFSFLHDVVAVISSLLVEQVFRAAHRTRVMPYLEEPAPERLIMTAGKSILEGPSTKDTKQALKVLDEMLEKRLKLTI